MKIVKQLSIAALLLLFIGFTACNENPKDDDPTSTITPGGHTNTDSTMKDSATIAKQPVSDTGANADGIKKNNPDITN